MNRQRDFKIIDTHKTIMQRKIRIEKNLRCVRGQYKGFKYGPYAQSQWNYTLKIDLI